LESEILRKAFTIAFDRLVQRLDCHAVDSRQMGIEKHSQAAHGEDQVFDGVGGKTGFCLDHDDSIVRNIAGRTIPKLADEVRRTKRPCECSC
jgi:hypothetical protein